MIFNLTFSFGEALEVDSNEFFMRDPVTPGAAGERVVIVRPGRPGRALLSLDLKRPWQQEPIDHFEVEVNVTGQRPGTTGPGR